METEFTPLLSLLGGGLIGASAVLLMATHGRIAGISGILSRMLPPASKDQSLPQGLIFLIGLLLAAPLWIAINGQAPLQTVSNNLPLLALAGVLVGFGSSGAMAAQVATGYAAFLVFPVAPLLQH